MARTVLFLLLLCHSTSRAKEIPTAAPEKVGMSKEKLEKIQPALEKFIKGKQLGGVIVMVARKGKVVYSTTAGWKNVEEKKPMEMDTICRFYSMSKPITSVAVMILHDEGKVKLDDPVSKYIPELKDLRVYDKKTKAGEVGVQPKRPMTVRDLLRHTSGLSYGFFSVSPVDSQYLTKKVLDRSTSLQAMAKKLGTIPLLHHPGTKWHYSVSTDVLGYLVEKVSGRSLDQFFQKRIFEPLDMKDTGFHVPESKLDRFATNYTHRNNKLAVQEAAKDTQFTKKPGLLSGGGGLVSTARDYMRFCQMLLNKGELHGKRILKASTVEKMTKNQLPKELNPIAFGLAKRPGTGFGLGFSVRYAKSKADPASPVGEYGWGGAASTHFWISPRHDLAVVALTQYMPYSPRLELAVKPLVYAAIEE